MYLTMQEDPGTDRAVSISLCWRQSSQTFGELRGLDVAAVDRSAVDTRNNIIATGPRAVTVL